MAWKHVNIHASITMKLQAALDSKRYGNLIIAHVNSSSDIVA